MKYSKRPVAVVYLLFAVLLSSIPETFARDADPAPLTFAAAQTAKHQQCVNSCRARYRDCLSKKQIPSFECQNVYQDCTRFNCSALQ